MWGVIMYSVSLGVISLLFNTIGYFKEKFEKEIPKENFNNKKLMYEDKMNPDISSQQFMKNLKQGKYCSQAVVPEQYEKSVIIKDKKRYSHDARVYGKEIADDNAKQGLYSFILDMGY